MEEGTNLPRVLLQAAHGGDHLAFEVDFACHHHTAHGVGLQMLPHEFVGITIRRVRRQEEQLQPAAERFDKCLGLFRPMCRASVDDQENRARFTHQQPLDGTASPRARVSRLSGLESVSFRMAGKVARRNFNERRPPCRHYVRG